MQDVVTHNISTIPKHIGIIPDGNRRWARQNGVRLEDAYWYAMQKILLCLETLYAHGIFSVSVYLLSKDNIFRARDDLDTVFSAELRFIKELLPSLRTAFPMRVYHAGNLDLLPYEYRSMLNVTCELGNGSMDPFPKLYLCAGYDPYEEVVRCCNNAELNPEELIEKLYVPLELDAVIRTGGDIRISGFLPMQCKYAEFFYESYYFPDISADRILAVMDEFKLRNRRFGR